MATRFLGNSFVFKNNKSKPLLYKLCIYSKRFIFYNVFTVMPCCATPLSWWVLSVEGRRERDIPRSPLCAVLPLGSSPHFPLTMLGVGFCSLYLCTGYTALAQTDTAVQRAEPQTCPHNPTCPSKLGTSSHSRLIYSFLNSTPFPRFP